MEGPGIGARRRSVEAISGRTGEQDLQPAGGNSRCRMSRRIGCAGRLRLVRLNT